MRRHFAKSLHKLLLQLSFDFTCHLIFSGNLGVCLGDLQFRKLELLELPAHLPQDLSILGSIFGSLVCLLSCFTNLIAGTAELGLAFVHLFIAQR